MRNFQIKFGVYLVVFSISGVLTFGCVRPNYYLPVPTGYYVENRSKLKIDGGLSLSGLYFSSSINVYKGFLLIPNFSGFPWEDLRLGIGGGKIFSLIGSRIVSLSFTPTVFLNLIGYEGERSKNSPSITGIEFFPDLQLSVSTKFIRMYIGSQFIFIPYSKLRWEEKVEGITRALEEAYSDPFQIFLPSIYGVIELGYWPFFIKGGILYLLDVPEKSYPPAGLKDRFAPPEGTVSLGVVIDF